MKRTRRTPTYFMHFDEDGNLVPGRDPKAVEPNYTVSYGPGDMTIDVPPCTLGGCECTTPTFQMGSMLCGCCGGVVAT